MCLIVVDIKYFVFPRVSDKLTEFISATYHDFICSESIEPGSRLSLEFKRVPTFLTRKIWLEFRGQLVQANIQIIAKMRTWRERRSHRDYRGNRIIRIGRNKRYKETRKRGEVSSNVNPKLCYIHSDENLSNFLLAFAEPFLSSWAKKKISKCGSCSRVRLECTYNV